MAGTPSTEELRNELARVYRDQREPHFKRLMVIAGGSSAEDRYARLAAMAGVTAERMKQIRMGGAHLRTRGSRSEYTAFETALAEIRRNAEAENDDLLLSLFDGLEILPLAAPSKAERKLGKEEAVRRLGGVVDLGAIEVSFVEVCRLGESSLPSPALIVRAGGAIRLVPVPIGANADANIDDGEIRSVELTFQ